MSTALAVNVLFVLLFAGVWAAAAWFAYRVLGPQLVPALGRAVPHEDPRQPGWEDEAA